MPNEQLLAYVREHLGRGESRDEIIKALLAAGWQAADVTVAFNVINPVSTPVPPASVITQQPTLPSPSIGGLYSRAWQLYSSRFKLLVGIMLVTFLLPIAILSLLVGSLLWFPSLTLLFGLLIFIGTIVMIGIAAWGGTAVYAAVIAPESEATFRLAMKRAAGLTGSVVWIGILIALIIPGGFLLLIVPGFIFLARFSFAPFVLFDENTKGLDGLLRSAELVKGRTGLVLWQVLAIYVPYIALQFVFNNLIPLLINSLIPSGSAPILVATIIGGSAFLISFACTIFMTPFLVVYLFVTYQTIKKPLPSYVRSGSKRTGLTLTALLGIAAIIIGRIIFSLLYAHTPAGADSIRKVDLIAVQLALESYEAQNKLYPDSLQALSSNYLSDNESQDIFDPATAKPYAYELENGGSSYSLCATLSNGQDYCVQPLDTASTTSEGVSTSTTESAIPGTQTNTIEWPSDSSPTQPQAPTQNTYTDPTYGYTVTLPVGWNVGFNIATDGTKSAYFSNPTSADGAAVYLSFPSSIPAGVTPGKMVSGSIQSSADTWDSLDVYEQHSGKIFYLQAEAKSTQWTMYQPVLMSIINSFQFTK